MMVLHTMIDQIVHLHPNLKYLHIGSDEVYELGRCPRCIDKMKQENWNRGQLFLNHVRNVAKLVHILLHSNFLLFSHIIYRRDCQ